MFQGFTGEPGVRSVKVRNMIAKPTATRGTIEKPDSNSQDDSRTFKVLQSDGATSRIKLRRQNIIGWGPNGSDTTGVTTQDGKSMRVCCRFTEFHAWVIAPALEHDRRVKEAVATVKAQKPPPKKKSVRR